MVPTAADAQPCDDADADALGRFPAPARASLLRIYTPEELARLDRLLAQPCEALHVRCNLVQATRDELLAELRAHRAFDGYELAPHAALGDVITVQRQQTCSGALAPYLELEASRCTGTERFAERRRLGLPPHEIFVDRLAGEAILKGADIFVKGIRAASLGLDAGHEVSIYVDLHGALLRGSVCEDLGGMRLLGTGVCCIERAALFREERGLGVRVVHTVAGDLPALRDVLPGKLYVQSLPSLVVAHVLAAQPGERVLDMCAAPGSKATHVATNFLSGGGDASGGGGGGDASGSVLVACERNHGKLAKMRELCETLGVASTVQCVRADSTRLGADARGATHRVKKKSTPGLCYERGSFDRVLVDPPCSALGLRPKLLQTADAQSLQWAVSYQRLFLWVGVQLLRVGGTLVYSTCTLTPDENEGQVAATLERFPCLRLAPATPRVGAPGRLGAGLDEAQCALVQRFEPSEGTEGFFIARFVKVAVQGEEGAAAAQEAHEVEKGEAADEEG